MNIFCFCHIPKPINVPPLILVGKPKTLESMEVFFSSFIQVEENGPGVLFIQKQKQPKKT